MEYLVESHLGGYYVSSGNPEIIEETCEECFDNDMIVASWVKGDKKERIEGISNYLCGAEVDEEAYNNYLEECELEDIMDIEEDLCYVFSCCYDVVNDLEKFKYIDVESAGIIRGNIMLKHGQWLRFARKHNFYKVLVR